MKKITLLVLALSPLLTSLQAQERYFTRTGTISFFSATPMENIEAHNYKVTSIWDATTGGMEYSVVIKAFEFEKALMQEHFNENYMESNTYPKATFKGTIRGITSEELKKPGSYPVDVEGELTIHGVAKQVKEKGTVKVDAKGAITASSDFIVVPEDHKIEIPGMVRDKIAKEIKVEVRIDYEKM